MVGRSPGRRRSGALSVALTAADTLAAAPGPGTERDEPAQVVGGIAAPERSADANASDELGPAAAAATVMLEKRRAAATPADAAADGGAVTAAASEQQPQAGSQASREEDAAFAAARAKSVRISAAAPAPPVLRAATAADETPVEIVPAGRADAMRRVVYLPARAAPPAGQRWTARIAADGAVTLLDAAGRDIGATHTLVVAVLRSTGLASGEYTLTRR